jgi:hypothetical protein
VRLARTTPVTDPAGCWASAIAGLIPAAVARITAARVRTNETGRIDSPEIKE